MKREQSQNSHDTKLYNIKIVPLCCTTYTQIWNTSEIQELHKRERKSTDKPMTVLVYLLIVFPTLH